MVSKAFANSINQSILGKQAYTAPETWYFGITTQDLTDGNIPSGAEPTNPGYSRTAIPNDQENFTHPDDNDGESLSVIKNAKTFTMTEITGGSEFTATHFFLSSQPSGNTAEIWGTFAIPRKMQVDSQLIVKAGAAVFELLNA